MSKTRAYQEKLEAQLNEWQAKIHELEATAAQATADAKIEYEDKINDLRARQNAAREKLAELQEVGEDTRQSITKNLEGIWSKLGQAVKTASSKISGRSSDHTSTRS